MVDATPTARAARSGPTSSPAVTYSTPFQPKHPKPSATVTGTASTKPTCSTGAIARPATAASIPNSIRVRTRRVPPPRSAIRPQTSRDAAAERFSTTNSAPASALLRPSSRAAATM